MSHTHILDVKDIPALPGCHITNNGHRHINLDALFHEELRTEHRKVDGRPGTTVFVRHLSRLKLAGNARQHESRVLGETITLHDFFTFSGWDENNYGRVAGRTLQGPHMHATRLPVTLAAFDGDGPEEVALLVEEGDTLEFMGTAFRVTFPPHVNRNMVLDEVVPATAAA